jgi:hypothetical protein
MPGPILPAALPGETRSTDIQKLTVATDLELLKKRPDLILMLTRKEVNYAKSQ